MKTKILLVVCIVLLGVILWKPLFGSNGDKYLGVYRSKAGVVLINKAGENGYFVKFDYWGSTNYERGKTYFTGTVYCVFKNDCFVNDSSGNAFVCVSGENKIITNDNYIFTKKK